MRRLSPATWGVLVVLLVIVGVRLGMASLGSATASPLLSETNGAGLTVVTQPLHNTDTAAPIVRAAIDIAPSVALLPDALAATAIEPVIAAATDSLALDPTATPTDATTAQAAPTPDDDTAIMATSAPSSPTPVPPTAVPPTATAVPPTATPVPPTATSVPPTPTPVPPTVTPTFTPIPPTSTPTRVPTPIGPTATPTFAVVAGTFQGQATPYANSLAGNSMGCSGAGPYNPADTSVIAVGASQHTQFPCGTKLEVCGPAGCITGVRKDSCYACGNMAIDLSRAGFNATCGPAANNCQVRIRTMQ